MPTAGDAFLTGQLPTQYNPLQRLNFNTPTLAIDAAKILADFITFLETYGFAALQQLTGLDFTVLKPLIEGILKLFTDIVSFNWVAAAADLVTLAGFGINATALSGALSQSVTSTPPVTHDASSHGEVHTGNPTTKTVPHTTAAAANPAMVAHVAIGPLAPKAYAPGFVTVTYNGVALESKGAIDSGHATNGWLEQFTLKGPASGTHDVVVTTSAPVHSIAVNTDTYVACSGFSAFVSAATDSQSQSLTVRGGSGGLVVVGMASAAPIAALTGATQRSLQNIDTATTAGNLIVGDAPGADSVTVTATR